MAHFRGTLSGGRGETSRLGTKGSGLMTECNGWNLGATCHIEYNEKTNRDEISVAITTGSNYGNGRTHLGVFYINKKGGISRMKK